jgi:hypothetical protein
MHSLRVIFEISLDRHLGVDLLHCLKSKIKNENQWHQNSKYFFPSIKNA